MGLYTENLSAALHVHKINGFNIKGPAYPTADPSFGIDIVILISNI